MGAETTFQEDQGDKHVLQAAIKSLTQKVHRDLMEYKMRTGAISIKLRYPNFKTITRARKLLAHTHSLEVIQREFLELLEMHYTGHPALRLIGISLRELTDSYWQPSLFDL